jgi:hypothetical protein
MKVILLSENGNVSTARLVSPPFNISGHSCVQFKYLLRTIDLNLHVKVESAQNETADPDNVVTMTFTKQFYQWDAVWLDLRGTGWRRLLFEASYIGKGVSSARQIFLDSVLLSDQPCKLIKRKYINKQQDVGAEASIGSQLVESNGKR